MFLDFKLGLLWSALIDFIFHLPLSLPWFLAGIVFAFLPDIDFWIELAQRGTVGGKTLGAHRTLLHNPILYLPLALFIGAFFGTAWMLLFVLGVFGHFIHDSMGMGFGVRWLWPFSTRYYKIFSDRSGNIHYDIAHLMPLSWTPEEVAVVIQEKGNDNWLREDMTYMRNHAFSIVIRFILFILTLYLIIKILQLA